MPHYKIYSVLGLADPAFRSAPRPDYKVPIHCLHASTVKSYIVISSCLNIIGHSQHPLTVVGSRLKKLERAANPIARAAQKRLDCKI